MDEIKEITVSIEKDQIELKKSRVTRILYIIGGTLSLILAVLGVIMPGLPTTPFALLAAYLYAKSSKKLYNWLLSNRLFGPRIRNYNRRKGVTRKGKIGIILFMWTMVSISSFIVIKILPLRIVVLSLGLIGAFVVWFIVPTAKPDN
jgi:uncharacterized membrane protein YbaN (DUF454 family)